MKQFELLLKERRRGFHLITDKVLGAISELPETGIMHLFIKHTSAGICINENADPTVLEDMSKWFNSNIKENELYIFINVGNTKEKPSLVLCER